MLSKEEAKAYQAKYYAEHKDKWQTAIVKRRAEHGDELKAYHAAYYRDHADKLKADNARYYAEHKEQATAASAKWHSEHPEVHTAASAKYYATHKERCFAATAAWHAAHPEKTKAFTAKWRKNHPGANGIMCQRRYARRRGATVSDLTAAEWTERVAEYRGVCAYCLKPMGKVTQDHMTPLSRGGDHTLANTIPCCRSCNSKKGTKTLLEYVAATGGAYV